MGQLTSPLSSLIAQSHAVSAVRNVSVVEDVRVSLAEAGVIPILLELLVSGSALAQGKAANCISILASTDGIQEVGAKALVLLLFVKSNRKELVRDEKSLMRLSQMLDPKNESVSKKFPVAVVAAIMAGGSRGCRKKLVAAGVYGHLQRLVDMDVAGAKKALQRLSGNRLGNIFSRAWRD